MIPQIPYDTRSRPGRAPMLRARNMSPRLGWAPVVLAVAVTAAACDDDGNGEFLVRDSAGVRIATSRSPAWGGEPGWRLTEPSVVVRGADGTAYPMRVSGVHRFPDGRILVLDTATSRLRFHAAAGHHLRTVGGPGSGPGEYRSLDGVAVIDDSLWIWDRVLGRVSVLDMEGRYLRSFRLEPTGDPLRPLREYRLAGSMDDSRLVLVSGGEGTGTRRVAVGNLLYSRRGFLLDSIAVRAAAGPASAAAAAPRPAALAHADGMLYRSDAGATQVAVYDHRDGLRRIIRAETANVPALEPAHGHRIVVSERGSVWIQKHGRARGAGPADWLVFDADGRWLGVVESPRDARITRFEIHQVGPWGVLAVWRDRDDVEHVGVWPVTS